MSSNALFSHQNTAQVLVTGATMAAFTLLVRRYFFSSSSLSPQLFTIVVEKITGPGYNRNQVFQAVDAYLTTIDNGDQEKLDSYKNVEMRWKMAPTKHPGKEQRCFELTFEKKHIDIVLNSYLPYILEQEKATMARTISHSDVTFDNLDMDLDSKKALLDDLNTFRDAKELYGRIGKAWNRRYLLYGPSGTGKSNLAAAMANHLNYDFYEVDFLKFDQLGYFLQHLPSRSTLVIKNVDCNNTQNDWNIQFMVLQLLQLTGGLWSCCANECVIILTTDRKENLHPDLLRSTCMDMHIDMLASSNSTSQSSAQIEGLDIYLPLKKSKRRVQENKELLSN